MAGDDGYPEIPEECFGALVAGWQWHECSNPTTRTQRTPDGAMFSCSTCNLWTFVWWKEVTHAPT